MNVRVPVPVNMSDTAPAIIWLRYMERIMARFFFGCQRLCCTRRALP